MKLTLPEASQGCALTKQGGMEYATVRRQTGVRQVASVTILKIIALPDPPGFRLVGEVDMSSVSLLKEALDGSIHPGGVTLDLAELTFIDSSGIHCIVQYALGRNGAGPLILVNARPLVRRTLEIVGVGGGIPQIELRNESPDG